MIFHRHRIAKITYDTYFSEGIQIHMQWWQTKAQSQGRRVFLLRWVQSLSTSSIALVQTKSLWFRYLHVFSCMVLHRYVSLNLIFSSCKEVLLQLDLWHSKAPYSKDNTCPWMISTADVGPGIDSDMGYNLAPGYKYSPNRGRFEAWKYRLLGF